MSGSDKEFPDSVIKQIDDVISYNAPLRSLSTMIPLDSVKFGRDCLEIHNDIIKKIFNNPRMRLGDRIVGNGSTHEILKRHGRASALKVFSFITQKGKVTKGNAKAHKLKDSIGAYIKKYYGKKGVSLYGVSAMNGYHSMLVTYRLKNGADEFSLIDQGPATSLLSGKSTFHTVSALDKALSEYVRDKQGKRTKGGYEYPANVQVYKIYPDKKK